MLVSSTPLRVSFLGGGTDFPWFFEEHGGAVLSTTINKFIYISALPSYDGVTTYLKYSKTEFVSEFSRIEHPIFRTVLSGFSLPPMDWSVMADVPAGNGLASSSAFTVGLVNAATYVKGQSASPLELAQKAIHVELDLLNEPIGIQDQLASAFGGLNLFQFSGNRKVSVSSIISQDDGFPFGMVLVKVGPRDRRAGIFTREQRKFAEENREVFDQLKVLRDLTLEASVSLRDDIGRLPEYVRRGWELKVKTNPHAISTEINEIINTGYSAGAEAGKLVGAGGSGFVLFLAQKDKTEKLIELFWQKGTIAFEVKSINQGSKVTSV